VLVQRQALADHLARLLDKLGLDRVPTKVTTRAGYIAERDGDRDNSEDMDGADARPSLSLVWGEEKREGNNGPAAAHCEPSHELKGHSALPCASVTSTTTRSTHNEATSPTHDSDRDRAREAYARGVVQRWYRVVRRAELRAVRVHDLRHTYASLLLAGGEPMIYVNDQPGHSTVQVTVDLYGHVRPGANRDAVNRLAALTSGSAIAEGASELARRPIQRPANPEPLRKYVK
jgi:hypothetical protein